MTAKTLTWINPAVSCTVNSDGTLTLRIGDYRVQTEPLAEIVLGPLEYMETIGELNRLAWHAVGTVVAHLAAGNCPRCQNIGLIQDPDKTIPWHIHCPDCGPRRTVLARRVAIETTAPLLNTHEALL